METLKEAKEFIENNSKKGTHCPCCGVAVKTYKRKLNSGMAAMLVHIFKEFGSDSYHIQDEFLSKGKMAIAQEYSKLRYWGLLDSTGKGYWRLSAKGSQFVRGEISISKHVLVRNGKLIGFSNEIITISDALGSPFNYQELMAG